jgi:N-acetylneuraminate lyase
MQLTGLIAAPHTPFNSDFSLNLDCVPKQAAHLVTTGVKGAFVAGTTGESLSLTTTERIDLFHAWGEAAKESGITFIAHIGHNSLPDAQALAGAAQAAGAEAIGAMAPTFFKPDDARALVDWFARITEPAREVPFYFYDIPSMTGVNINTKEFVQLVAERVPGFAGVKYTNADREQLRAILALENHSPDMLWGCDEELLDGLEIGCRGAVGSSYNFAAFIYHRVMEAFGVGNLEEARRWQARSLALIDTIKSHGYMYSAKAVMGMVGVDCGQARPPLPQMTDEKLNTLRKDLEIVGFFEWIDEYATA